MPTPVPDSLRAALGEEGADALARWLDEYLQEHAVRRDEYREVLSRLDVLEERVVQLEKRMDQRFEQIDERLNQLEQRLDDQSAQFNERLDALNDRLEQQSNEINARIDKQSNEINARIDKQSNEINARIDRLHEAMRVQTRWTIGTLALFGTIITVLIAIAEFFA